MQQSAGWSRFRLRFNYQDGPASSANNSDGLNNPATPWGGFPYVSCNNLLGAGSKIAPLAGAGSAFVNPAPWPGTQVTVPASTLLLSVEGSSGPVRLAGGVPTGFSGAIHTKTVQTLLKFANNQPITSAAIMSAGDLDVSTFASPDLKLSSDGGGAARLRSKAKVTLPNITTTTADLRHGPAGVTNGTVSGTVTTGTDSASDGFYRIPLSKVRTPGGSMALGAGVYVVTNTGTVMYHNMNYKDYALASPPPAGTLTTLPTGMTLVGPNPTPPKFRIDMTADLKINPNGPVTDFALIPDGGAPQSAAYGDVPAATATPPAPPAPAVSDFLTFIGVRPGDDFDATPGEAFLSGSPLSSSQWTQWNNVVAGLPVSSLGTFSAGATYTRYDMPGGGWIGVPDAAGNDLRVGGLAAGLDVNLTTHLNTLSGTQRANLQASYPAYVAPPAPSASPPGPGPAPSGSLSPSDLELNMQGGSGGLVVSNANGSMILGSQIQGNGAALISGKDISLIGTSTELSSSPGSLLGLNLYAQGTITIDAYKMDPSGTGSFHGVNLKGILYSWQGINVFAGNSTTSADFNMRGSMVAYGGNPAAAPVVGGAATNIKARSASIVFDPSYVASLVAGGPFALQVVSWHEF